MSTIEITRVEDVREGDVVTLAFEGHEFTGKAWNDPNNEGLNVGPAAIEWYGREDGPHATFVRATREVPDLPTEPGSVIVNATIRGTRGATAFLTPGEPGIWRPDRLVGETSDGGGWWWAYPEHVTAWTPARIVPEDGAS